MKTQTRKTSIVCPRCKKTLRTTMRRCNTCNYFVIEPQIREY